MDTVLCVLYDDHPVDRYPKSYPRDVIPGINHYLGGQTTQTPKAISFTPGHLLGSVSGELGLRRLLADQGDTVVVTSDKNRPNAIFGRKLSNADVVISEPFWPEHLIAAHLGGMKKLKLAVKGLCAVIFGLSLLVTGAAQAATHGIPQPDCHQPPALPRTNPTAAQAEAYNEALPGYKACIEHYVSDRKAALTRFSRLADEEANAANAAIRRFDKVVKKGKFVDQETISSRQPVASAHQQVSIGVGSCLSIGAKDPDDSYFHYYTITDVCSVPMVVIFCTVNSHGPPAHGIEDGDCRNGTEYMLDFIHMAGTATGYQGWERVPPASPSQLRSWMSRTGSHGFHVHYFLQPGETWWSRGEYAKDDRIGYSGQIFAGACPANQYLAGNCKLDAPAYWRSLGSPQVQR